MSRAHRFRTVLLAALLAGIVAPAEACAVMRPLPTRADAAAAQEPRFGLVGRIGATFTNDETKRDGQSIVQIEVTEDFSGKLPRMIFVFNPGCCVCVGIGGNRGEQVLTIVRRGDDGLFHLAY